MKFASFFIALFVSVLTHARTAAANDMLWAIQAPTPQHKSCEQFGSAYTGKSGKGMSMGKSGKGLPTSKSSKANSSGTGTLKITYAYGVDNAQYFLVVNNVHPKHCVGELKALAVDRFNEVAHYDDLSFIGNSDFYLAGNKLWDDVTINGLFTGGGVVELDLITEVVNIAPGDDSSGGSEQIQNEPVRS